MKHRHSGPPVSYRTKRGRVMARKRPIHPITRKHKREGRRGSRRKSTRKEMIEELLDNLKDIPDEDYKLREEKWAEIDELERRKTFEEEVDEGMNMDDEEIKEIIRSAEKIAKRIEAERREDEYNESKQPGWGKKDITHWDKYTGD